MSLTSRIRIDIDLLPAELEELVLRAIKLGFTREEPTKAWTNTERRAAARYYVIRMIARDSSPQEATTNRGTCGG